MSAQGDHAFKWFTAVEPAADSTAVSPCGAPPQTLYTTLLSGAASNSKDYECRQCGKSCTMANIKRDMVSHLSRTENTKCLELHSESSDQREMVWVNQFLNINLFVITSRHSSRYNSGTITVPLLLKMVLYSLKIKDKFTSLKEFSPATHCNTLQHTTTHWNTLQYITTHRIQHTYIDKYLH